MLSLLWTSILRVLAWIPLQLIGLLRSWQLGRRGVVRVELNGAAVVRRGPEAHVPALLALDELADDPLVRGVLVQVHDLSMGWATLQDYRRALVRLRSAGKLVLVHLDTAGNGAAYLSSAADRVWLTPSGQLDLLGIGTHMTFFGTLLQRLGVQVDLESAGAYKSFGEPYTRGFPSAHNREAMDALLADLQDQLVAAVAKGRGISVESVQAVMSRAPVSPEEAVEAGIVDGTAYPDQVLDQLGELLGGRKDPTPFRTYSRLASIERWLLRLGSDAPRVAVVHLSGPIMQTETPTATSAARITAGQVVPLLDKLREDDRVRAVVLSVNSPGGSALASDLIARAVARLSATKPVVASFVDVSASGGYYLSAPASEIVARPGTITGSIGVVGGKLVFGPALARLGVTGESVLASPNAGMYGPWAAFTPEQRERFRETLVRTYKRFLDIVAGGRRRPVEAIAAVAEGRVWTGAQAKGHGLVDHLGGLDTAISRARVLAGLDGADKRAVHITLTRPRFQALAALLGRAQGAWAGGAAVPPDLLTLGLASAGEAGELGAVLRSHPGEPLAMVPWVLPTSDG